MTSLDASKFDVLSSYAPRKPVQGSGESKNPCEFNLVCYSQRLFRRRGMNVIIVAYQVIGCIYVDVAPKLNVVYDETFFAAY